MTTHWERNKRPVVLYLTLLALVVKDRKSQAYNKSIWQWSGTKICSSRGLAGTLLQVAVIENKQVLSACGLYQLIGCNVASLLAL